MEKVKIAVRPRFGGLPLVLLAFVLSGMNGCASAPPADSPAPAPQPQAEPAAHEATEESPPPPPPAEEAEPAPPQGPSPTEVVAEICEDTCKQVEGSCSERAASFCRASCGDYVSAAEKCPVEVRDALSCQKNADDFLLCSNIAAESCANLYRSMKKCREGEMEPQPWGVAEVTEEPSDAPPGFDRKAVDAHGFSVLMPTNAELKNLEGGAFTMSGTDGGIDYVTESLELGATKKPTSASILRTATKYVGNECQPKLRLHGRFETAGVIHVRFDTVCESGKIYHGILHFWDGKAVVATTITQAGASESDNPKLEPFLFGYQRLGGSE